jgi:malate synthase
MINPLEQITISASISTSHRAILSDDAVRFLAKLANKFEDRRQQCLCRRRGRQKLIDEGLLPDFLAETAHVRASHWSAAGIPLALLDRRLEITGPVNRKTVINALNSGANVFMADFEDSNAPTWENNLEGQLNLREAVDRTNGYTKHEGKYSNLLDKPATLMVRPRGWHLIEKHFLVDGDPISASLFDFGLFFFHNARALADCGAGPYFYLPKIENQQEARLWNDIFIFAQKEMGIPHGTVRATVLIETILAAFEMDEILYELREHSAGLRCGRWDYIFSFIKTFRNWPEFVLPHRADITMGKYLMNSCVQLLIQTCHRRKVHAMGGMAAQIPIKNDPVRNEAAIARMQQDKLREVRLGHDGTSVAHPGLVMVAKEVFDAHMKQANQIGQKRPEVRFDAQDLLTIPRGNVAEDGLRSNINVGLQYLAAWLGGNGCVPICNLMEDAATAEICRAQIWQWLRYGAKLSDGRRVNDSLVRTVLSCELDKLGNDWGSKEFDLQGLTTAANIMEQLIFSDKFSDFLTLVAYDYLW